MFSKDLSSAFLYVKDVIKIFEETRMKSEKSLFIYFLNISDIPKIVEEKIRIPRIELYNAIRY